MVQLMHLMLGFCKLEEMFKLIPLLFIICLLSTFTAKAQLKLDDIQDIEVFYIHDYFSEKTSLFFSDKSQDFRQRTSYQTQCPIIPVKLGVFCTIEDHLAKKIGTVWSFRLGTLSSTNQMEYSPLK